MTGRHPELTARQRQTAAAACAHVTQERLRELVSGLTAIPSPTGDEAPLADHIVSVLQETGICTRTQPLDEYQANAVGRLPGTGDGADLLLYAPIDTLTTGNPAEDLPWIGATMPADALPAPHTDGDYVTGLGASNPKGHAACIMMAAEALRRSGAELGGDVILGFGAGGMPTNARERAGRHRRNTGQGAGCSFMLEQGVQADFALIAKPGWAVSAEEVGLCWFDFTVTGTHTYAGSRHLLPYRNAIADAGQVIRRLEAWFENYAERHATPGIRPQGVVSSIRAGWPRMAAVTPAACWFRADLRIAPGTPPLSAYREIAAFVRELRAEPGGADVQAEMSLSIPGTATPSGNWIVASAIAAWERMEGRPHRPPEATSGATDANILRSRGLPTARIGMPKVTDPLVVSGFRQGMNTVDVRAMERLTRALIEITVDTVTRPRGQSAGDGP